METVWTWIATGLVFGLLVAFHEFGHFCVAKLVGIKVHEFAIGMGPRIFKILKGETEYSLRILPIGGYVKMEGEDEASDDERSFNKKPLIARILVIVAGPLMNILLAVILFIFFSYAYGYPTTTIQSLTPNYPAQLAGIEQGDKIISINDQKINKWNDITQSIQKNKAKTIKMIVEKDGQEKTVVLEPKINPKSKQIMIGIVPTMEKSFSKSVSTGIEQTYLVLGQMFEFFKKLLGGHASTQDVVGPVGIIYLVGEVAKTSIYNVLSFGALISVNLAIVNLLPIPALDGGRLVFLIIEGILGRPIDPEKEGMVHLTGFILLMGLMVFMIYKDITRFHLF